MGEGGRYVTLLNGHRRWQGTVLDTLSGDSHAEIFASPLGSHRDNRFDYDCATGLERALYAAGLFPYHMRVRIEIEFWGPNHILLLCPSKSRGELRQSISVVASQYSGC